MLVRILLLVVFFPAAVASGAPTGPECVFVLHGLGRTPRSMAKLAGHLEDAGFDVHNLAYPSRRGTFPALAGHVATTVHERAGACAQAHFVTYSLGGLLVRRYLEEAPPPNLGRVVMIAPPNKGSEIVDSFGDSWFFRTILGPVASRLATAPEDIPAELGPPRFPLGVIAGDRAINPVGAWLLPEPNDGTVSVDSTRLAGMADFFVVHRSHTFILQAPEVAAQTIRFLRDGRFEHDAAS
jgi:pimeloyl-ACP methyl ester carboxylesterase